jgi:nucleotidyltransferase/DNA polymerase involved in DNA repair
MSGTADEVVVLGASADLSLLNLRLPALFLTGAKLPRVFLGMCLSDWCKGRGRGGEDFLSSRDLAISLTGSYSKWRELMQSYALAPLLSEKDETESNEGGIDPLGTEPLADALAVRLVPGVRERQQIRTELQLTASAGVAPNKFLAKIASDWKKPDGIFVIQPEDVDAFLLPLPVGRVPGVGKVTEGKLKGFDVQTIADLRRLDLPTLESRFGRYGVRLYELARGVDASKVVPDRPTQSISAEDTFECDVPLTETVPMIRKLAELTWAASRKESRIARTVVLKLKTAEFKILTRSHTPSSPPSSCEELTAIALSLRERVGLGPRQRFRLVGVGLSNFFEPEDLSAQSTLFE